MKQIKPAVGKSNQCRIHNHIGLFDTSDWFQRTHILLQARLMGDPDPKASSRLWFQCHFHPRKPSKVSGALRSIQLLYKGIFDPLPTSIWFYLPKGGGFIPRTFGFYWLKLRQTSSSKPPFGLYLLLWWPFQVSCITTFMFYCVSWKWYHTAIDLDALKES